MHKNRVHWLHSVFFSPFILFFFIEISFRCVYFLFFRYLRVCCLNGFTNTLSPTHDLVKHWTLNMNNIFFFLPFKIRIRIGMENETNIKRSVYFSNFFLSSRFLVFDIKFFFLNLTNMEMEWARMRPKYFHTSYVYAPIDRRP